MAGRRFDVADVVEVLRLWDAGRSDRQIARSTGTGRNRVARITRAAEVRWAGRRRLRLMWAGAAVNLLAGGRRHIYVCTNPVQPWGDLWPQLRHYD